jgi:hypothetical protein
VRAIAAGALALLLLTAGASAETWRSYHNERFGATAEVPSDWQPGEPPDNDDGLRFTSPDGQGWLSVYGSLKDSYQTVADEMGLFAAPDAGETVTYTHRTDRSIVVSGTVRDRIFYRKMILVCRDTVWDMIWIEYPSVEKEKYDELVTRFAGSLQSGDAYWVAECP